ncbi:MAG TPA: DNA polymerase III subunit alpha [Gammaproteobacteria bacterium]|nr:DNA polymerase III subunit alpha [Gammaproteobacteria bacterium]
MAETFVHLRLHSEYSLVDSVVRIPELMKRTSELEMPAVALTDAGNLFALIKFYRAAEACGIKPIIGADLTLLLEGEERPGLLTVLVCDRGGYRTLCRLITRSYAEGQHGGRPQVNARWFDGGAPGLIALAGRESPIGHAFGAGQARQARERLECLRELFPTGMYLELTRTDIAGEENFNRAAIALALESDTAAVATNNVRFLRRDDYEAHEARVAIHQGYRLNDPGRERLYSPEQYLKSAAEMAERFADLPAAIAASFAIAERASLELDLGRTILPAFPLPAGEDERSRLRSDAEAGLARRLEGPAFRPAAGADAYRQRLAEELDIIAAMGFAGYFLIVADFIAWAREHGVSVGPGRGSGAGSLVAYALNITDLDPIAYDLLFERFLNPERVSMPDFDVDFGIEGRDRVIDYVAARYGRDHVSQIITFGSMAAKAVVRDVGRVLGHPYGYVDKIAKLVPPRIGIRLEEALKESTELRDLRDSQEDARGLIDLALKLEGLARNAGKHAGGVVIAPAPLSDYAPLYAEANGAVPLTQLDKDDIETIGLVKFDFLGLLTLTIMDRAERIINAERLARSEPPVVARELPLDDRATYALLKSGATTAIFQLESRGMKELIARLQPDCFEDIIALNALFRPGPLQSGMVEDYIARKQGKQKIAYPHPELEGILKSTYGVILYQEQVMQIARVMAGYTLGSADLLRRAMGKKKPEEMARQREIFMTGSGQRGVAAKTASHVFDLMEKFAGYGFNKSHSAAYALIAYQTAWLKAHYPAAFMAAVLSSDMDHSDKTLRMIDECRRMGLAILPPDVNRSAHFFELEGEQAIRFGLGAIKGLGETATESLVSERRRAGPYRDLADLCARSDAARLNRRSFEALIEAGALDELGAHRAALLEGLPRALAAAEQKHRAGVAGQVDFFGLAAGAPAAPVAMPERWSARERLAREKRALGLYLSGHPMERYQALLPRLGVQSLGELAAEEEGGERAARQVRIAGLIAELRRFAGRTAVTLDDGSGRMEGVIFADVAARAGRLLLPDHIVVLEGRLGYDDYFNCWRVTVSDIVDMESLIEREAGALWIDWHANGAPPQDFTERLKAVLTTYRGGATVVNIRYRSGGASACLRLGGDWRVAVREDLIAALEGLHGVEQVEVSYQRNAAAY